ncbi:MAG: hypothetical protein SPG55_03460 [Prevotella sp.]|nr:hypothetical protein [Prevotellaceae bacterium]MDY5343253.1 hypothetical protein [Prevotella sp.]
MRPHTTLANLSNHERGRSTSADFDTSSLLGRPMYENVCLTLETPLR